MDKNQKWIAERDIKFARETFGINLAIDDLRDRYDEHKRLQAKETLINKMKGLEVSEFFIKKDKLNEKDIVRYAFAQTIMWKKVI